MDVVMGTLEAVTVFVRAVQQGSLSAAARSLGMSPASASRMVSGLEDEIGVRLLLRTSRHLALTDAGEEYYTRVSSLLPEFEQAREAAASLQSEARGVLRVHSRTMAAVQILAPALKQFADAYPNLVVDLHVSETAAHLIEDKFDVDIRIGELADSSEIARKLAPAERILIASPAYLEKKAPPQTPEELGDHACLLYRKSFEPVAWRFRKDGAVQEHRMAAALYTNSGAVLLEAALSGHGIAMLHDWAVRRDIEAGRLCRVLESYEVTNSTFENAIYAVFQQNRNIPIKTRMFIDFISQALRAGVP
jgi:DNA-binding transcriptional LysR family regulator